MKTFLVSITECLDREEDLNERVRYIVPANSKTKALEEITKMYTDLMLMDDNGYPVVLEITSTIRIN